jgi:hypothetical protein
VFNDTVDPKLDVNAEEGIIQDIIADDDIPAVVYFYPCIILDTGYAGIDDPETFNQHPIGLYRDDLVGMVPIQYRVTGTDQCNRFIDDDIFFMVCSCIYQQGIPGRSQQQSLLNGLHGPVAADSYRFSIHADYSGHEQGYAGYPFQGLYNSFQVMMLPGNLF